MMWNLAVSGMKLVYESLSLTVNLSDLYELRIMISLVFIISLALAITFPPSMIPFCGVSDCSTSLKRH